MEASAQVVVSDEAAARQAAEQMAAALAREYAAADPGLRVEVAACEVSETPMDKASTEKALCMLTCLPNGIQAMSMDIPGLVQTSLNLGILDYRPGGAWRPPSASAAPWAARRRCSTAASGP